MRKSNLKKDNLISFVPYFFHSRCIPRSRYRPLDIAKEGKVCRIPRIDAR